VNASAFSIVVTLAGLVENMEGDVDATVAGDKKPVSRGPTRAVVRERDVALRSLPPSNDLIPGSIHREYDLLQGIGVFPSESMQATPMPWGRIVFVMNTTPDEIDFTFRPSLSSSNV
jgi:hypothetical protein